VRRLLVFSLALGALWFAARAVADSLRTDEERIRLLLQDEVEAFNGASMLSTLDCFADDYRDTSGGFDRAMLRSALLWAFHNRRDSEGRFRHRCDLGWDALAIDVDEAGDAAEARFPLTLFSTRTPDSGVEWDVDVVAKLRWTDGRWLVASSTHKTTRGKRPW
jgi:hypothetical protein